MKHFLFLISLLFIVSACDKLEPFLYIPPVLVEEDFTNPNDPRSDDFLYPKVTITNGPSEGELLTNTNDVMFGWEGVHNGSYFKYRLDNYDNDWSPLSNSKSKYYTNLPNGQYKFRVKELLNPDIAPIESEETTVQFSISSYTSELTELVFNFNSATIDQKQSFAIEIMAFNVENLMGGKIQINFDPFKTNLINASEGDFFNSENTLFYYEVNTLIGFMTIEFADFDQTATNIHSGTIASILVYAGSAGNTQITIDETNSELVNFSNQVIALENYGVIDVTIN